MPIDDNELNRISRIELPMPVPPACPQCRYNLTGLRDPICPECGYRFDWKAVRRKARAQWLEALGLKTLPEEIEFGFWLGCFGWGLALLIALCGGLLRLLEIESYTLLTILLVLKVITVFAAFCSLFLCAHILKFRRLPPEASEALRIDVPVHQAWMGLLIAGLLLPVSVLLLCLVWG